MPGALTASTGELKLKHRVFGVLLAVPLAQQSDGGSKVDAMEEKHSAASDRAARHYNVDGMVRIFKALQAASALPPPAELQDAVTADPELLATPEAPAGVLQLLSEPLQVRADGCSEAVEQGMGSLSLRRAPEGSESHLITAEVGLSYVPTSGLQPQTSALLAAELRDHDRTARTVSAGTDQVYCYKDPSGVMQVSTYLRQLLSSIWARMAAVACSDTYGV